MPLFVRPFLYFIYRYFIKLGFLDGKEGLIFHFLQGFWYRFLVDAKIYEIEKKAHRENKTVKQIIDEMYKINF
ncbi:MAG: glycosyltransferase family 2 protein, partial [Thermoplasmata archaeon]